MLRLRDLPIQRKLRVVVLATCTIALIVASGVLFGLQFLLSRNDYARDLTAASQLIGHYASAVLATGNADDAASLIASLKTKPTVVGAEAACWMLAQPPSYTGYVEGITDLRAQHGVAPSRVAR